MKNPLQVIARKALRLIHREHEKDNYIYSLDQTLLQDEKLLADAKIVTTSEIKTLRKCFGEAQIDMLYESSDAAVRGINIPEKPKHALFLKHLEDNLDREGLIKKAHDLPRHIPKSKSCA